MEVFEVYCYLEWIRIQKTVLFMTIHSAVWLALHISSERISFDSAIQYFLLRRVRRIAKTDY